MNKEEKVTIKIDVIEIIIAIMMLILMDNCIAIRKDIRNINKDILLQSGKYYETEYGEIINE